MNFVTPMDALTQVILKSVWHWMVTKSTMQTLKRGFSCGIADCLQVSMFPMLTHMQYITDPHANGNCTDGNQTSQLQQRRLKVSDTQHVDVTFTVYFWQRYCIHLALFWQKYIKLKVHEIMSWFNPQRQQKPSSTPEMKWKKKKRILSSASSTISSLLPST